MHYFFSFYHACQYSLIKSQQNLRSFLVRFGKIKGFDFWLDKDLFEYWKHAHFTLDVTDGIGAGGFSLETPYGKTFKVIYRLFTEEEADNLEEVVLNTY